MASKSRPQLIIEDTNMGSYTLPADIHPALANINIKDWSYQQFVLQVILLKIPVNSVGDIEQAWIDSLNLLGSRKDIDIFYRSFIKRLIDYQPFEKLDSSTEFVLSRYLSSQMQLRLGSTIKDIYHQTEQQSREAFVSNKVSICLDNDNTIMQTTSSVPQPAETGIKKRPYEDVEELQEVEANYLFEEGNERNIISTIDDQTLSDEVMLNIYATKSSYTSEEIKGSFDLYRSKISKTKRIVTPGYWGIIDLTKESLFNCKEINDDMLKYLSKEFSNVIQWKPESTPSTIQDYFNSNCSINLSNLSNENKKFNANIQYIVANIDVLKGNRWGEIQSYSTKEAQNEDANPFQKDRIGRKVDMIGNLKETSFKVEVLFGEVSGGLGPFGLPAATRKKRFFDKIKLSRKSVVLYGWTQHGLEINVYALKWEGNSTYLFGLVDKGTLPSCENECGLFEDLYCIFKELERQLKKTEENIKALNLFNVRSKRRNLCVESTPEFNLTRTPK
ncbi:13619_t:CDS:10 [Funneliformis mosseae]|uniref:13619_t:CDS:1 n=1 Tax=Funneliformis mosseae TaxID=27381 RepID=A0A9N9F9E0_FUNMO|nr:13619_t:CDS:10 [Funneliformis mosseae]